ncbi:carbamoyl-phosphate synthase large subunit [Elusimicrobium simillimum]|uniref:carbamoyl-phosphate synthase (glutamine-hydrolyzing) large subunit n=1 Tax=Elusimicrobium simillimum TaxID=3143438 RepID=UPI003C703235
MKKQLKKEYKKATLELSNGIKMEGRLIGAPAAVSGEMVFSTGMLAYSEAMTDPSYLGQILVFSFSLIGNYGIPSLSEGDFFSTTGHESESIKTQGIIVSDTFDDCFHYEKGKNLQTWMVENGVPGIAGVDTRYLVQMIRDSKGPLFGRIVPEGKAEYNNTKFDFLKHFKKTDFVNPSKYNLMPSVSVKEPVKLGKGKTNIALLDFGVKRNIIRLLVEQGCTVTVYPWDTDLTKVKTDGWVLSNGPGDPANTGDVIARVKGLLKGKTPVLGICLGHQILALAAGAKTKKLTRGHRSLNQPVFDVKTKKAFITSQNHSFEVDKKHLPKDWVIWFENANDLSVEGLKHKTKPFMSTQFHPEASGGPNDTAWILKDFIGLVKKGVKNNMPILNFLQPKKGKKQKVLLLGSGALSIGQAGEFDYSGSQAIKALEEEGLEVIVLNPNIASVQTNPAPNKKVYLYPVTPFWIEKIIKAERPAAIIAGFGGQTSLNCVIELENKGILKKYGVKVLGTQVPSLEMSEDRDLFSKRMAEIAVPTPPSKAVETVADALKIAKQIGYPVITRSAYALGGLGSGLAETPEQLEKLALSALTSSPQILIEKSLHGWKEIEYEVMRDSRGNCITICNMENFDPMGIHTGDSIVIAPCQTLNNKENNMLRDAALNIVKSIGVVGECNVQFALSPFTLEYYVIEINARLSRSSALASKATGYPIAFVAAKVVCGFELLELKNPVTQTTSAFYEPSLDYVTLKVPRWDLKKFSGVSKELGTQMKSVGEVMSIGRNFCEVTQKALRMVQEDEEGITKDIFTGSPDKELLKELSNPTNLRIFAIYELFKRGYSAKEVHNKSKIEPWFLSHLFYLAKLEGELRTFFKGAKVPKKLTAKDIEKHFSAADNEYLRRLKSRGFSDYQLTKVFLTTVMPKQKFTVKEINALSLGLRNLRKKRGVTPVVKQIDTTSAEYATKSNYLYLTYDGTHNDISTPKKGKSVVTLGSGSYRIGSSLEFDWCSVMTSRYFKQQKDDSIIINCNPETVSTDFNTSDRLYFEELSFERVMDIIDIESPKGVVACMGGQNPNNLTPYLSSVGVNILGHSYDTVEKAENRTKFSAILDALNIDQPKWTSAASRREVDAFIKTVGFPVLIRPSFVLSGTLMNVASDQKSLDHYLSLTKDISADYPVVLSQFIQDAREIECDGVAKNGEVVVSFISEHVENAGVHSGDATMVFPAEKIYTKTANSIRDIVRKIAKGLNLNGPFNIQFIAKDNDVKVIECNARASRSFPFITKVSGQNLAEIACKVMNGEKVSKIYVDESEIPFTGVKASMFSFQRLDGADPVLGVEMASTGEVGCIGANFNEAMLLAMESTHINSPKKGILLSTGREKDKIKFMEVIKQVYAFGLPVYATKGTADYLNQHGYKATAVRYHHGTSPLDIIKERKVDFVINVHKSLELGELEYNALIRKMAVKCNCSLLTNLEKAIAYFKAFDSHKTLHEKEKLIHL